MADFEGKGSPGANGAYGTTGLDAADVALMSQTRH